MFEGTEIMVDYKGSSALNVGLVAVAEAVEHYEISRYDTLCAWAKELGHVVSLALLKIGRRLSQRLGYFRVWLTL